MELRKASIAIVGPGRVGQALGKLLVRAGYAVRFVAARRLGRARRAVKFIGGGRAVKLSASELTEARVILLTTADAAVALAARDLARMSEDWSGRVVLHTCGSLPATVLEPFRRRGAAVGSLHPYQTIPNPATGVRNLVNCTWAVEGDPAAVKVAAQWVKELRGVTFRVPAKEKTLYHLSAFLVCPTTVALMDRSLCFLRQLRVPEKIARPMLGQFVAETARNFAALGGRGALTGPAARGDWGTIRGHLRVLRRRAPELVPLYRLLVGEMARVAKRRAPSYIGK